MTPYVNTNTVLLVVAIYQTLASRVLVNFPDKKVDRQRLLYSIENILPKSWAYASDH